ncbi:MAG TPA: hypothetical protein VMM93_00335, partial [Vicinamibacterales bacterium]|nr:hypothetical protein [Vicinamibacterales bacterium]
MVGFWAKLYVFWAVIEQGMYALAFLGALLTVVALYYYLVVARYMYIDAPVRAGAIQAPASLTLAIALCLVGVIGMGVYPGPWVDGVLRVGATLFP